jgi:hypothetical protein
LRQTHGHRDPRWRSWRDLSDTLSRAASPAHDDRAGRAGHSRRTASRFVRTEPIDFLATGTAQQLRHIIDGLETHFSDAIDGITVIFGTTGLMT